MDKDLFIELTLSNIAERARPSIQASAAPRYPVTVRAVMTRTY